jgi:hypothetical protein
MGVKCKAERGCRQKLSEEGCCWSPRWACRQTDPSGGRPIGEGMSMAGAGSGTAKTAPFVNPHSIRERMAVSTSTQRCGSSSGRIIITPLE